MVVLGGGGLFLMNEVSLYGCLITLIVSQELDSDMQMLVYENYNKFISCFL